MHFRRHDSPAELADRDRRLQHRPRSGGEFESVRGLPACGLASGVRREILLAVLLLASCGRRAGPVSPLPSLPLSRALRVALDAGARSAPRAQIPKRRSLALEVRPWPAAAPSPPPRVAIVRPAANQRLALSHAADLLVELRVRDWPRQGIELALDGFRPRRLATLEAPVRLGALVPADQRLTPGQHRLIAIAVRAGGRTVKPSGATSLKPYALVRFTVGRQATGVVGWATRQPDGRTIVHVVGGRHATGAADSTAPQLIYSEPRGTYNGARAADAAFIDYYVLNAPVSSAALSVACRISHAGAKASFVLKGWRAFALHGLKNGDYTIELRLRGADGKLLRGPGVAVERTFTVNRDAPTRLPAAFRGKK